VLSATSPAGTHQVGVGRLLAMPAR